MVLMEVRGMTLLRYLKKLGTTKNRSLLVTWLISYISILLIPIVISGLVYAESTRIVEREINNNNVILLKQIQKLMDKKMNDVKQLGLQVAWNPKLKVIFYNGKPMNSHGCFTISEMQKDFRVYKIANGYIDELYVYLHNSDMIVTSGTSYSINLLETALAKDEKISAKQFKDLSQKEFKQEFTTLKIKQGTEKEETVIAYLQSLPYDIYTKTVATMLILLNNDTFLDEISGVEELQQGTVLILGEESQIVAITDQKGKFTALNYNEFKDDMLLHKEIEGQNFVMSSISSKINEWKYIFILPSFIFMEKVKYIKSLMVYSVIFCLVIGGIVAYIFTKMNYNPIHQMVQLLAGRAGIELNPGLNEYSFVQEAINNTLDEKEIIKQKLEKQHLALRSGFLGRLIKGTRDQAIPIEEALSSYKIQFISDIFCVILFYIKDFSKLFAETSLSESDSIEQVKLVHFIITNVVEELVCKNHYGVVTEVDDMMVCLVNVNKEHAKDVLKELVEITSKAQSFIRDNFFIYLTISIGGIHKNMAGIPQSYREAQEAMEYRIVIESEKVIQYDEIRNPMNHYDYPMEMEQQLINSIKVGDLKNAQEIVSDVFKRNFSGEMLSIQMVKCLLFDLMSTMIKALNDICLKNSNTFIEELNPLSRLLDSNTIMEMKYQMMDILKRVCEYVEYCIFIILLLYFHYIAIISLLYYFNKQFYLILSLFIFSIIVLDVMTKKAYKTHKNGKYQ